MSLMNCTFGRHRPQHLHLISLLSEVDTVERKKYNSITNPAMWSFDRSRDEWTKLHSVKSRNSDAH